MARGEKKREAEVAKGGGRGAEVVRGRRNGK